MQVRRAFLSMLASWLGDAPPKEDCATHAGSPELPNGQPLTAHRAALFPYVMALLADDSPAVAGDAVACLERLGARHMQARLEVNTDELAALVMPSFSGVFRF